jgi:hypothetical protein
MPPFFWHFHLADVASVLSCDCQTQFRLPTPNSAICAKQHLFIIVCKRLPYDYRQHWAVILLSGAGQDAPFFFSYAIVFKLYSCSPPISSLSSPPTSQPATCAKHHLFLNVYKRLPYDYRQHWVVILRCGAGQDAPFFFSDAIVWKLYSCSPPISILSSPTNSQPATCANHHLFINVCKRFPYDYRQHWIVILRCGAGQDASFLRFLKE